MEQEAGAVGFRGVDLDALADGIDEGAGSHGRPVAIAAALVQALGLDAEAHAQLGAGQGHELAEGAHAEAGELVAQPRRDAETIEGHAAIRASRRGSEMTQAWARPRRPAWPRAIAWQRKR